MCWMFIFISLHIDLNDIDATNISVIMSISKNDFLKKFQRMIIRLVSHLFIIIAILAILIMYKVLKTALKTQRFYLAHRNT